MMERTSEAVIRRMTLEDLAEVLQIDRLSFPLPWSERSYRFELTENPASHMLVAVRQDGGRPRVVGYAGFWMLVDEAHISTLAVHPDCRRAGLGAELLRRVLDDAARSGAEMATLEVRVSNQAAVNLYHKFGFQIVGRRTRYYRDNGEDALLMTAWGIAGRIAAEAGGRP
jgi:ribosomal-protein-alanine N-acetyltransferase